MKYAVNSIVMRGDRPYIIIACDDERVRAQAYSVTTKGPTQGRPVDKPLAEFEQWLNNVPNHAMCTHTFVIEGVNYAAVSYSKPEECFVLRAVAPDGAYRVGRPRKRMLDEFSKEEQEILVEAFKAVM